MTRCLAPTNPLPPAGATQVPRRSGRARMFLCCAVNDDDPAVQGRPAVDREGVLWCQGDDPDGYSTEDEEDSFGAVLKEVPKGLARDAEECSSRSTWFLAQWLELCERARQCAWVFRPDQPPLLGRTSFSRPR